MGNRSLDCLYFPKLDRFLLTDRNIGPDVAIAKNSQYFTGIEYFRYIPFGKITLGQVSNYLISSPQELCCEVNKVCNLICPICIAEASSYEKNAISIERFNSVLDKAPSSIQRITLTGGEPTLHPSLPDIVHHAAKKSRAVVIATNGFLPEKLMEAICGVRNIILTISLQGPEAIHDSFVGRKGAFDRAMNSLILSLNYCLRVEIHTTMIIDVLEYLPSLVKILNDLPISEHRLNIVKMHGRRKGKVAGWNDVVKVVEKLHPGYKLSVKRQEQPFLFFDPNGNQGVSNVLRT